MYCMHRYHGYGDHGKYTSGWQKNVRCSTILPFIFEMVNLGCDSVVKDRGFQSDKQLSTSGSVNHFIISFSPAGASASYWSKCFSSQPTARTKHITVYRWVKGKDDSNHICVKWFYSIPAYTWRTSKNKPTDTRCYVTLCTLQVSKHKYAALNGQVNNIFNQQCVVDCHAYLANRHGDGCLVITRHCESQTRKHFHLLEALMKYR